MTQIDRIEEKLDRLIDKVGEQNTYLARVDERLGALEEDFAAHILDDKALSKRINTLERWYWTVVGGVAVLSFGTQFILKMVK